MGVFFTYVILRLSRKNEPGSLKIPTYYHVLGLLGILWKEMLLLSRSARPEWTLLNPSLYQRWYVWREDAAMIIPTCVLCTENQIFVETLKWGTETYHVHDLIVKLQRFRINLPHAIRFCHAQECLLNGLQWGVGLRMQHIPQLKRCRGPSIQALDNRNKAMLISVKHRSTFNPD